MNSSKRLVDDLARHVRRRVLRGEFAMGARISESSISSEYGVARPTAKAALDALVADGLLIRPAYSALRVTTVGASEVPHLLALLEQTESRAAQQVVATGPDLRPMRRACTSSVPLALQEMVRSSGSDVLNWSHRRATFELLLASQQLSSTESGNWTQADQTTQDALDRLLESLFHQDDGGAQQALRDVQASRRQAFTHITVAQP